MFSQLERGQTRKRTEKDKKWSTLNYKERTTAKINTILRDEPASESTAETRSNCPALSSFFYNNLPSMCSPRLYS